VKDAICRYKTMRGFLVERKAGWDTHGLPVEIGVEKQLNLESKEDIEKYGVAEFTEKCLHSVFTYKDEWEQLTRRMGYWVDMSDPYVTCTNDYVESVWHILKLMWDRDLIYKGHKILPYCPRCGTPLSSHEVAQGYRDAVDPSVFIRMKLKEDPDTSFLVWTTTPWTLISNVALAVAPTESYVKVKSGGENLILAEALLSVLEEEYEILESYMGLDLIGKEYEPLYTYVPVDKKAWCVIGGDFVTLEDGTGIVHTAPAFGEDDYRVGVEHDLPFVQPVDDTGSFTSDVKPWAGMFIKDADPLITEDLEKRGLLYKSATITHTYPFCWRCDSPLVYYARHSWYVRTTQFKSEMIENNAKIKWHPKEIGANRLGDWLENNVDWAVSRDRYWGTPLNIWICEKCEQQQHRGATRARREHGSRRGRPSQALRRRCEAHVRRVRGRNDAHAGGHRLLVRHRQHAVRAVALALRECGAVRTELPGGLHCGGRRPDQGMVLLAAGDLDHHIRDVVLQALRRQRHDPGRARQEDEQVGRQHRRQL
jgi:isoleucyl-tRNA synthetase